MVCALGTYATNKILRTHIAGARAQLGPAGLAAAQAQQHRDGTADRVNLISQI